MTIPVLAIGDYIITFSAEEEEISPRHHFIKECGWTESQYRKIRDFPFFCAKVSVWKDGECLNDQYLGACSYESEEQFYTTYKGDYFHDMVVTAFEELELPDMAKQAHQLLARPCQHDFEAKAQDGGALSMSQPVIYLCAKCGEKEED